MASFSLDSRSFPYVDIDLIRAHYPDLKVEAAAGWHQLTVPLEALEELTVSLTGEVVWYHRIWTSAGSCGRTNHHQDHRTANPNGQPVRLALGPKGAGGQLADLITKDGEKLIRQGEKKLQPIDASLGKHNDLRLVVALEEAVKNGGNPGDNSGAFNLDLKVTSRKRIERFFEEVDAVTALSSDPIQLHLSGSMAVATRLRAWFPARLRLYPAESQKFRAALCTIGNSLIKHTGDSAHADSKDDWLALAAWLGEWSVTSTAGGSPTFGDGWMLRAKTAVLEGQQGLADDFFREALKNSDAREQIFYELGKLRESQGILFSPEGKELKSIKEAVDISAKQDNAGYKMTGAYDFYRLSLVANTRVEGADQAQYLKPSAPNAYSLIKTYDAHYALGRLSYLRHTTSSLSEGAGHFKVCRRFAQHRLMTREELWPGYTFQMLLDETMRFQRNAFQLRGEHACVGYKAIAPKLDIKFPTFSNLIGDTPYKTFKHEGWLALNGPMVNCEAVNKDGVQEILDHLTNEVKLTTPDATIGEMLDQVASTLSAEFPDSKALAQAALRAVTPMYELAGGSANSEGKQGTEVPSLNHWLQNPMLLLPFIMKHFSSKVGASRDGCVVAFDGYELKKANAAVAANIPESGTGQTPELFDPANAILLVFKDRQGSQLDAIALLFEGRMRLSRLLWRPAGEENSVRIDVTAVENQPRKLASIHVQFEVPADHSLTTAAGEPWVEIQLTYPKIGGPPRTISLEDYRLAKLYEKESLALSLQLNLSDDNEDPFLRNRSSLVNAYIPFRRTGDEDAFRRVTLDDARWALGQAIDGHVAVLVMQEMASRVRRKGNPDERIKVHALLFDAAGGHFVVGPNHTRAVRCVAATGLLMGDAPTEAEAQWRAGRELGWEIVSTMLAVLRDISGSDDSDEASRISRALGSGGIHLEPVRLPALIEHEETRLAPNIGSARTTIWLDTLASLAREAADENSVHINGVIRDLVRPVISSGLASLALAWLEQWDIPNDAPLVRWLSSGAVPLCSDIPDQGQAHNKFPASRLHATALHLFALSRSDLNPTNGDMSALERALLDATRHVRAAKRAVINSVDTPLGDAASALVVIIGFSTKCANLLEGYMATISDGTKRSDVLENVSLARDLARLAVLVYWDLNAEDDPIVAIAVENLKPLQEQWKGVVRRRLPQLDEAMFQKYADVIGLQGQFNPKEVVQTIIDEVETIPIVPKEAGTWPGQDQINRFPWLVQRKRPAVGLAGKLGSASDEAKKVLQPQVSKTADGKRTTSFLQISPLELDSATATTWERVLHDEPYADSCIALLALADRHLARKETEAARERLLEAQNILAKLQRDDEALPGDFGASRADLISEADRSQLDPLRKRVKLRLAWLDQGRDAYGRFITKAPPCRLDAAIGQLSTQLKRYDALLNSPLAQENTVLDRVESSLHRDHEMNDALHMQRQARLLVEKNVRSMAYMQRSLSTLSGRRIEVARQRQEGLGQFKRGEKMLEHAESMIGNVALAAASAIVPAAASGSSLGGLTSRAEEVKKALDTAKAISNGEDPLRAVASAYGRSIIEMSFSAWEPEALYSGRFKGVLKDAAGQLVREGRINVDEIAQRTMRNEGERLLNATAKNLGERIESAIRESLPGIGDLEKKWSELKSDATDTLEAGFEEAGQVRDLVNNVSLSVTQRVKLLDTIAKSNSGVLERMVPHLPASSLPVNEMVASLIRASSLDSSNLPNNVNSVLSESRQAIAAYVSDPAKIAKTFGIKDVQDGLKDANLEGFVRTSARIVRELSSHISSVKYREMASLGVKNLLSPALKLARRTRFPMDRVERILLAQESTLNNTLREKIKGKDSVHARLTALENAIVKTEPTEELIILVSSLLDMVATEISGLQIADSRLVADAGRVERAILEEVKKLQKALEIFLAGDKNSLGTGPLKDYQKKVGDILLEANGYAESLIHRLLQGSRRVDGQLDRLKTALSQDAQDILGKPFHEVLFGRKGALLPHMERAFGVNVNGPNGFLGLAFNAAGELSQDGQLDFALNGALKATLNGISISEVQKEEFATHLAARTVLQLSTDVEIDRARDKNWYENISERDDETDGSHVIHEVEPPKQEERDFDVIDKGQAEGLLENPGTQALIAAISTAYPVAGLVFQGVQAIGKWLQGSKAKEIGAQQLERAETEIKRLDGEISTIRHEYALLEIDQLVANDNVARIDENVVRINSLRNLANDRADRKVYLQRVAYERLWTRLELLSYQLYVVQKAFEYEFDVPLEEILTRWPSLEQFRPLLELSPGVMAREFSHTSVHRDLLAQKVDLESLPEVIRIVRELAVETRFRDKIILSIATDYPNEWACFRQSKFLEPIRFSTVLSQFNGAKFSGRALRHSIKIRRVQIVPTLTKRDLYPPKNHQPGSDIAIVSPEEQKKRLELGRRLQRISEKQLSAACPDRLKYALLHAGIGEQMDESGVLRTIEWGPQMLDSGLEVEDAEIRFNQLEGLTPATRWTLVLDRDSGLLPEDFDDIKIEVEVTYGRHEENLRDIHAGLAEGADFGLPVSAPDIERGGFDAMESNDRPVINSASVRARGELSRMKNSI